MDADSEHTQLSRESCPKPARFCHLVCPAIESSKGYSTILQRQLLQDGGNMVKITEYHKYKFTVTLLLLLSKFLDPSKAVRKSTMIDKPFCKFTNGSFVRSTACKESKCIFRVSIPLRTKCCLFHDGKSPGKSTHHQIACLSLFTYHFWGCCLIRGSVLVSATSRLGTGGRGGRWP